jgi:hypothetical protein
VITQIGRKKVNTVNNGMLADDMSGVVAPEHVMLAATHRHVALLVCMSIQDHQPFASQKFLGKGNAGEGLHTCVALPVYLLLYTSCL